MDFAFGADVVRLRRRMKTDPYTNLPTAGDWTNPVELPLPGSFVASSSSTSLANATRTQILTAKSLYLSDPSADVVEGDRIRVGTVTYEVPVVPAGDVNPFTGWQPVKEVPIEEARG